MAEEKLLFFYWREKFWTCVLFSLKKQILVHLLYKLRREDLQFVTNSCDNQMRVRFFSMKTYFSKYINRPPPVAMDTKHVPCFIVLAFLPWSVNDTFTSPSSIKNHDLEGQWGHRVNHHTPQKLCRRCLVDIWNITTNH